MLKPGPTLDALVAKYVMQWNLAPTCQEENRYRLYPPTGIDWGPNPIPKYSADLNLAFEVLESGYSVFAAGRSPYSRTREVDFRLCKDQLKKSNYWLEYMTIDGSGLKCGPIGTSAAHAICLAALECVTYNVAYD